MVELRKGIHYPIVKLATEKQIQDKLEELKEKMSKN